MLSVIIPAWNEALALPATLSALTAQQGDFETLLVDGGSEDETLRVAGEFPRIQVLTAERGRASQMNAGAAQAQGELLLFLHADTLLPDAGIALLNAREAEAGFSWGGFHHRFSGTHPALSLVSRLHNFRCGKTKIFYGDQAMVVRRSLFEAVGGFPTDGPLEDIRLSELLLAHEQPEFFDQSIVTDSRKFEQMGPWISLFRCLSILISYELRLPLLGRRFFAPIR
jgi:rSAM/selenodomain-associated transferase 2